MIVDSLFSLTREQIMYDDIAYNKYLRDFKINSQGQKSFKFEI